MKIVKLDESIPNLDRVEKTQPVEDIIMADAQQASQKISSKSVLERVREIIGTEAFLGAKEQPTPKKVTTPEPLRLDESLFLESDTDNAEVDTGSDNGAKNPIPFDVGPTGLNSDKPRISSTDKDDAKYSAGSYNMSFDAKEINQTTGNSWLDNTMALIAWRACVRPGLLKYVPFDMVEDIVDSVGLTPQRKNSYQCPMMKRFHIFKGKGNTLGQDTTIPDGSRWGAVEPGRNLAVYLRGTMDNKAEAIKINKADADAIAAGTKKAIRPLPDNWNRHTTVNYLDPAVQSVALLNPSRGITVIDLFNMVDDYIDNEIPVDSPLRTSQTGTVPNTPVSIGTQSPTANNSPVANTPSVGNVSGSTPPSIDNLKIPDISTTQRPMTAAERLRAKGLKNVKSVGFTAQKENLIEDVNEDVPKFNRKRSLLLPPNKHTVKAMDLYRNELGLEEDVDNPYVVNLKYFDLPTVRRLCSTYGYTPNGFCYDVFGDEGVYERNGGKFDGDNLGEYTL